MHICYVDESGNEQVLDRADAPPVLAIVGLIVPEARLKDLLWGFVSVKKQYARSSATDVKLSELIRVEIKGGDLRADLRSGAHRRERRALGIIRSTLDLLEQHGVQIAGRVYVKCDGKGIPASSYYDAIAKVAIDFQSALAAGSSQGIMILDSRTAHKNVPSVNGITTRKFKSGGDTLPLLIESPVFGHSSAHVGLQIADIVASAVVFPLACLAYCHDLEDNVHAHDAYEEVREQFAQRLRNLEYRYTDTEGVRRGGLVVKDHRGHGGSVNLYLPRQSHATADGIAAVT